MPGHKGANQPIFGDITQYDLTEVKGLDSLYEAEEAILQTEKQFSSIYGTKETVISASGSSLCIQTMLAMVCEYGNKIICGRNIHTSAVNAMALLGMDPVWVYPKGDSGLGLGGAIDVEDIELAIEQNPDAVAVYITSPDYFGIMSDIPKISALCKRKNVFLVVDNAHGAYLKFLDKSLHPMDLGADLCCDSLHKTLPVLTGGAILHINNEAFVGKAKRAMSVFGSTSPSYLIMLSCDICIDYLKTRCKEDLKKVVTQVAKLSSLAKAKGFTIPTGIIDPMRVTLVLNGTGYDKTSFRKHLEEYKIEPEYLSDTGVVFMISAFNAPRDLERLEDAINNASLVAQPKIRYEIEKAEKVLSLRESRLSPYKVVAVEESVGMIAAEIISPCPPGIPIVMCGEKITKNHAVLLKGYGVSTLYVLK